MVIVNADTKQDIAPRRRSRDYRLRTFACLLVSGFALLVTASIPLAHAGGGFTHQYLTLDLPQGWQSKQVPAGSEKEVIGYLSSDTIAGTNMTVSCYRGAFKSHSAVRIAGLKTLAAVYPAGQKQLQKPKKLKTASGAARVELWQGFIDIGGGKTVALQTPMGVLKTKHCWLLMMAYTPDSTGPQAAEALEAIIKTAR